MVINSMVRPPQTSILTVSVSLSLKLSNAIFCSTKIHANRVHFVILSRELKKNGASK